MAIRRASKSSISTTSSGKRFNLIAGYSPAVDEMDLIERVTVGAGGQGAITFSSIPQTYQHLQIRVCARSAEANSFTNVLVRINNDSTANYTRYLVYGNGTSVIAAGDTGNTSSNYFYIAGNSLGANVFGVGIYDILDYTNSTKYKEIRALTGWDSNGSGFAAIGSGSLFSSTAAITSLTFLPAGSTYQQHSTLSLYGVVA